jgi:1,4-dihydroxy-2-naphthoyl-CoA hydrolase
MTEQSTTSPSLTAGGFVELLGLRFDEVTPDRVAISWDVTPALHQPYGIVHGGVYASVVETAASIAAAAWLGERGQVVGVNNSTDFLRAVREGTLHAVAEPVHRGRLQQLWLVEIRDEGERLVARGQVRLQNIPDADRLGGR